MLLGTTLRGHGNGLVPLSCSVQELSAIRLKIPVFSGGANSSCSSAGSPGLGINVANAQKVPVPLS